MENNNNFSTKELALLEEASVKGVKPIGITLSSQMMHLFFEGYSCKDIAKVNHPFTEMDVLYARKKYRWDEEKEAFAIELNNRIKEKLIKNKLDSIEHITSMLSVHHKEFQEQAQKYIQTGKPEDKPDIWIKGADSYKKAIEILQKITGEDKVSVQKVKSESTSTITVENKTKTEISPELQDALLKKLSEE